MHMNLEDGLLACIKWYCYASSQLESPLAMGRMPATITLSHGQHGKRADLSELLPGDTQAGDTLTENHGLWVYVVV